MAIGLALHEHEIGRDELLRADFRRRAHVHMVARVFTVVTCAVALAGCGCTTRGSMMSQTANSKKVTESKKFTESKSRTPIPLPAAPLLSPQPEPSCEFETTESNADERQNLGVHRSNARCPSRYSMPAVKCSDCSPIRWAALVVLRDHGRMVCSCAGFRTPG